MAIGSKVSGNFKSASGLFAKVNGGWKKAKFGYIKVGGEWKQFWADKLEDAFNRIDTTNTLGVADSGQAWTILRSQWRINSNNANTTGSKSEYPLANIDAGFQDFELEANELTPGTGVAIRVEDANNWWGVVPFYNQTATTYSYCVASRTVSYCIASCTEPAGYTSQCLSPNTIIREDIYDFICPGGYELVYYDEYVLVEAGACRTVVTPGECYNEYRQNCTWQYVPFSAPRQVCNPGMVRICDPATSSTVCSPDRYELIEDYGYIEICESGEYLGVVGYSEECSPDGYDNVPYYACCQAGTYQECTQTATGVTYTNYYYLQVVKMVNGVFSVVADVAVPDRWSAVKISATGPSLTVRAFTDSLYTNQIGTYSNNSFFSTGTGYGVVARPSNFEDGRTIGSLLVKPLGQ
jgi:hypothetical protein